MYTSSTMARRAQERESRRSRLQEVARQLFDERGYDNTRVEDIARRANLSVGAIYLYFRSKDDLLISLLEGPLKAATHRLQEEQANPLTQLPPAERQRAVAGELVSSNWAPLARMMSAGFSADFLSDETRDRVRDALAQFHGQLDRDVWMDALATRARAMISEAIDPPQRAAA